MLVVDDEVASTSLVVGSAPDVVLDGVAARSVVEVHAASTSIAATDAAVRLTMSRTPPW